MNIVQTLPIHPTNFQEEHGTFISQLQQHILPEFTSAAGELNWGRLICTWHQKKESGRIVTHTYASCIDGYEGSIYLDCRPRKILAKCFVHLFTRPFHAIAKAVYHLSLYPIFKEIAKFNHPDCSKEEKIKNIFKAVVDIVLTPLYGIVLTVVTVAILIIGPFSVEYLYEGRKLLGKIELASNWGNAHTFWTLAPCFQPYPLEILWQYGELEFDKDTVYPDQSPLEKQLANFARAHIRYNIKHFDIFSCSKMPENLTYQSPILEFPA
ncbi:MAG TPA: hypothetical protein VGP47_06695 [Parachlamydiaceae bacterium]|nr:hypothetical protein [Parachlamydiaceae bacterium]